MASDINYLNEISQQTRSGSYHLSKRKGRQGFASMKPEEQRKIASKGGKAAHAKGTAHEWTSEEAKVAGRKGGQA